MNKLGKIVIVIALVVAVALVIALKRKSSSEAEHLSVRPLPVKVVPQQPSLSVETNTVAVKPQPAKALPRLVDLGASKCIPCKMMAPILEELKTEYDGILQVEFFDVWKNPDMAKKYGIRLIPTQIFLDASGRELFRHEGFFSKDDILAKWKQFGVELTKAK